MESRRVPTLSFTLLSRLLDLLSQNEVSFFGVHPLEVLTLELHLGILEGVSVEICNRSESLGLQLSVVTVDLS